MSRLARYIRRGSPIPAAPSIALALASSASSVTQGSTTTNTVTLTRVNFAGDVALAASGLPAGVTASFSNTTLSGGTLTSVVTFTASGSATIVALDAYTITATSAGPSASVNGLLTVVSSNPAPTWMDDFTGYADTPALQAVLNANTVYRNDSIDTAYCAIDEAVQYEGHHTLRYDFTAPQHTPQLVKSVPTTTEGWLQIPIRWANAWATLQSEIGPYQGAPRYFNTPSAVNTTANTIAITGHGQSTGSRVRYFNGGGASIGGLTSGVDYYVIAVDANTVKLATSSANASLGTAITLSSGGTGNNHYLSVTPSAASYKMMGFGTVNDSRMIFISTNGTGNFGSLGNTQECQFEGNIPVTGGNIIFHSPSVGANGQIGSQFYTNTFWLYTLHFKKLNNDSYIIQGWIHEYGTAPSSGKYIHIRWQGVPGQNRAHSINSILINRNYNCYRARDQYLHIGHVKYWDGTSVPDPLGLGNDPSVLPHFTISVASPNVTVARGTTVNVPITITPQNGWNGSFGTDVNADPSDPPQLPANVTAAYSPASPSAGATTVTLQITAAAGATPQTTNGHPFFVYGTFVVGDKKYSCNGAVALNITVT